MVFLLRFLGCAMFLASLLQPTSAAAGSLSATGLVRAGFTLSGHITSPAGAPVPGAVIAIKGSAALATTNSAGSFLLTTDQSTPVLQITCQGYQPQTLEVQTRNALAITLYPVGAVRAAEVVADAAAVPVSNPALVVPDVQPMFPGGGAAYQKYIRDNARYPEAAREANKNGTVFVSFVVDEQGRILDAQVIKGCGYGLDEEALRLIRLMPWWTPGLVGGKPLKVACTLRLQFGVVPGR